MGLDMYTFVLILHSWLRWLVLAFGIAAVLRSRRGDAWSPAEETMSRWFVMLLDIQLLLGLMLYLFLSPITSLAMSDFGEAMHTSALRVWALEHPTMMIVALVLAHIGRARSRRAADPAAKRRQIMLFFGLALIAILVGIQWPGMPNGRPLFRL